MASFRAMDVVLPPCKYIDVTAGVILQLEVVVLGQFW